MKRKGQSFERGPMIIVAILFITILVLIAFVVTKGPANQAKKGVLDQIGKAVQKSLGIIEGAGSYIAPPEFRVFRPDTRISGALGGLTRAVTLCSPLTHSGV